MATVLDLSQAPGVMTGYGLISAEHVRGLLPSADLRAIYVDEVSGRPISVGAVLRARWDPSTGRLLTDPQSTPAEATQSPPTTTSRRSAAERAEPSDGQPGGAFGPEPEQDRAVSSGQNAGLHGAASGDEVDLKKAQPDDADLDDAGLEGAESDVVKLRNVEPAEVVRVHSEQENDGSENVEVKCSGLTGSGRELRQLRDPQQVREILLAMVTPVWAVDGAEPQHDPSAALSRLVDLRDQRCCGPGCSISVGRTQRDHNLRWPEGPTAAWNLSVKSARCHRAKHAGWQVTIDDGGAAHWVSPLGRSYDRVSAWDAPPDLSGRSVLPAPRTAGSLSGADEAASGDRRSSQQTALAESSRNVQERQGRQDSDDGQGAEEANRDELPPF